VSKLTRILLPRYCAQGSNHTSFHGTISYMFRLSFVIFSEYFNTKEFLTCRNISTPPVHNKYLKYYMGKNITEYYVYIKGKR